MTRLSPASAVPGRPPVRPKSAIRPAASAAGILERAAAAAPLLSAEEEAALVVRWQQTGDRRAHDRLIRSHLRLVMKVAARYRRQRESMDDLVQEGILGLERALSGFRLDQGARFATYAVWWIRSSIQEAVYRTDSIVRAPRSNERFHSFFKGGAGDGHPVDLDLDRPVGGRDGGGAGATFVDLLADERETPEAALARTEAEAAARDALAEALVSLDERERRILVGRHGSETPETLTALGSEFGVSAERVRQIETRALSKMRGQLTRLHMPPQIFA
ncbi:MAG TPA: sigma-70 family RNA polymerase sigma factor [Azospirillaceae bacterium]|nr:sigma-70 family RNA polymerase sigma factor [Azospirillaceae bacterium]